MSANKYKGELEIDPGSELEVEGSKNKKYLFKSNFDYLVRLKETSGEDPMVIFTKLMNCECVPQLVLDAMVCGLHSIEGEEVKPSDKEIICQNIITKFGYEEGSVIAQALLSYAMIGSKKKSKIDLKQETLDILDSFNLFQLKNLKKRLLLWVLFLLISGICVCMISKLLEKFIVYVMG